MSARMTIVRDGSETVAVVFDGLGPLVQVTDTEALHRAFGVPVVVFPEALDVQVVAQPYAADPNTVGPLTFDEAATLAEQGARLSGWVSGQGRMLSVLVPEGLDPASVARQIETRINGLLAHG